MKLCIVSFLLTFLIYHSNGQPAKMSYIRERKVNAFNQIFDLKQGCLLVMLHMGWNKYEALKKLERITEAEIFHEQQLAKNKSIIKAFRSEFDFTQVYFFQGTDALKLLEYGIDSIVFLDDNLHADTSLHISKKFFVAEFNKVQEDTTGFSTRHHSADEIESVQTYQTGTSSVVPALIIESEKLIQLKPPFPYYVSIIETDERIIRIESVVEKLNTELHQFEKKAKRKILTPRFSRYFKDKSTVLVN